VKIDVYYGQLKSEEISQKEAYDVLSFFSKYAKYWRSVF